jgi:hypothetical protein
MRVTSYAMGILLCVWEILKQVQDDNVMRVGCIKGKVISLHDNVMRVGCNTVAMRLDCLLLFSRR